MNHRWDFIRSRAAMPFVFWDSNIFIPPTLPCISRTPACILVKTLNSLKDRILFSEKPDNG